MALFWSSCWIMPPWTGHPFPPLISPHSLNYPSSPSHTHTHKINPHPLFHVPHKSTLPPVSPSYISASLHLILLTNASSQPWEVNFVNGQQHASLSPWSWTLSTDQTSLAIYKHNPKYGWERGQKVLQVLRGSSGFGGKYKSCSLCPSLWTTVCLFC